MPPRPRNAEATKQTILDHARVHFEQRGYRGTTVKAIADAAGVSPNLVTRYFGGKDGLFVQASRPQIAADDVFVGDVDRLGERLAASIVRRWFGQTGEDPLLMLHRASGDHPEAAEALSVFLDENSLAPLRQYLRAHGRSASAAAARAAAVDAFVLGVSTRRRVLRADLGSPARLRRWLGETIQRLVD